MSDAQSIVIEDDDLIAQVVDRLQARLVSIDDEYSKAKERVEQLRWQSTRIRSQLKALGGVKEETEKAPAYKCDRCSRGFGTAQGLASHKTRAHKPSAAPRPAPATAAPPAAPAAPRGGTVLRCLEMGCTFTCEPEDIRHLTSHTFGAHRRQPTRHERMPVKA